MNNHGKHSGEPVSDPKDSDAPLGGSEATAAELEADNEAEEDTLRALDGEAPTG